MDRDSCDMSPHRVIPGSWVSVPVGVRSGICPGESGLNERYQCLDDVLLSRIESEVKGDKSFSFQGPQNSR
jgi:hypothetical protein